MLPSRLVSIFRRSRASRPADSCGRALRPPLVGLRGRIILLVLIALLPALLLFLYHLREERVRLFEGAEDRALLLARAWTGNHAALVREATLLLDMLARDPPNPAHCEETLRVLAGGTFRPSALAIVDPAGMTFCAAGADAAMLGLIDQNFLADVFASHSLQISEFRLDAKGRSFAFVALHLPAREPGAERAAIVAIDLADIQQRTRMAASGTPYHVLVLSRTGIVLTADTSDPVGTRLGAGNPLIPIINLQIEGTTTGLDRDGIEKIYAFTQMPQTGAKIAIELSPEDVVGVQEREVNRILVVLLLVAVLASLGAWLFAELSVVRWVGVLGRAADAYGRGDLDRRAVVPPSASEFAALADTFNGMAALIAAKQDDLRAARDAAETANRTKSEFLATMSHELRTPLNAVIGFSDLMLGDAKGKSLNRECRGYVEDINASGRHLLSIINDILDLSKAEAGKLDLHEEVLDPREAVDSVMRLIWPRADKAKLTMSTDVAPDLPYLRADERKFKQVLLNLLSNAVKFTPTGGTVRIAAQIRDGALAIAVTDTGIGIAPENLDKVLEPFAQIDASLSRNYEGTGLGLALVVAMMEMHGGSLALASALGSGTTATVIFPAERVVMREPLGRAVGM